MHASTDVADSLSELPWHTNYQTLAAAASAAAAGCVVSVCHDPQLPAPPGWAPQGYCS